MPRLSKTRKEMLTTLMKESIFKAATVVLCEHGVVGTTMNRVAEAADLAKSSLYDYFPSKDDLLAFIFDRLVAPFMHALEEIVRTHLPAPQKLERVLRIGFEHCTEHKAIIRLLKHSEQEGPLKKKTRPRILEAFTTIFEQGIQEGSFQPHNPAHTGRAFLGAFSELFDLQASNASEEVVREYLEMLIDAALHGLTIHVQKNQAAKEARSRSAKP
jgi:AcrR family transcriptional regulator